MTELTQKDIEHYYNREQFLKASQNGDIDQVKCFISNLDQTTVDTRNFALQKAAQNGHTEIVELLIPVSDPKADESRALWAASRFGHKDVIQLLIPVSDPKIRNSHALRQAAHYGYTECVKYLIPVSDPTAYENWALRLAVENEHIECIKLLIPVSNCNSVLNTLEYEGNDTTLLQKYIDEHEALQQKIRLTQTLHDASESKKIKPISAKRKM